MPNIKRINQELYAVKQTQQDVIYFKSFIAKS